MTLLATTGWEIEMKLRRKKNEMGWIIISVGSVVGERVEICWDGQDKGWERKQKRLSHFCHSKIRALPLARELLDKTKEERKKKAEQKVRGRRTSVQI